MGAGQVVAVVGPLPEEVGEIMLDVRDAVAETLLLDVIATAFPPQTPLLV